jgi:GT2 family glycosyltransferase
VLISVEIPVARSRWLLPCIVSVLEQACDLWRLSLLWDGADPACGEILRQLGELRHSSVRIHLDPVPDLAAARRILTASTEGEWILPLEDDCVLTRDAIATLARAAEARPWCGILQGRRVLASGAPGTKPVIDPVPFEPRQYRQGMTLDLHNCARTYLLRRSAYARTAGWQGDGSWSSGSLDQDMFLQIEEVAEIELVDRPLCVCLGTAATVDAAGWMADEAIRRRALPLERVGQTPPFQYRKVQRPRPTVDMIECVIPFWPSDYQEIPYPLNRPAPSLGIRPFSLAGGDRFLQHLGSLAPGRIELACAARKPVDGILRAVLRHQCATVASAEQEVRRDRFSMELIRLDFGASPGPDQDLWLEVTWSPTPCGGSLVLFAGRRLEPGLLMRLYADRPGAARRQLDRCRLSLLRVGIGEADIHVIEERRSSAANRNTGLARTSKPFVCFVDDDTEIASSGVFERLLQDLAETGAGLAGPKIVSPGHKVFCAAPYFDERQRPRPRGLGEPDVGQYDFSSEVPWLPSTFLLVRREVCLATGGFYEGFAGSQMEDVDFSLRARLKGFSCRYVGEVAVLHLNQERNSRMELNLKLLLARWRDFPHLLEARVG